MKSLIIKIGKAIQALKRDGFLNGSKRILSSLGSYMKMMKKLPSGDILFITNGVGDSALYRTGHHSEELENNGFKCSVTVQDNPFLASYSDQFKVFIFHRILFTPKVEKLIENIKRQNKEIIFETDDLIFDPKYLKDMDYFKNINALEKKFYEKGVGGEIIRDPYVKVCTTTTSFLADKLKEYGKKVFIVPNKLSRSDVEICEKIYLKKSSSHQAIKPSVKIGYFSGTISHNKDFAVITNALMEIMEKYPQTELFLVGPLDIENQLNKFKERVKQFPYAPRNKHFENVSSVDINLSPLEINPFCESKSELKFFEAGILKIPTVASPTQTFKEAISNGFDGFLAGNTNEWVKALQKLILEPNLRKEMGQNAYQKTLQKYTTFNAKNEEYYSYLRSKL